ncbi:ribonuclease HI protein [Besnoitia besnoiti]|uniref:ribonuclease H n=1 Tax=Besnoitia besnoiti TaxID=94643 RepID=A0A2A9MM25_BESBE|nr:ribonuclease HI protein [Besnoitia besnoiti]PFH36570.1 ribonuclease HI protein [Besnoitia besnoiti]
MSSGSEASGAFAPGVDEDVVTHHKSPALHCKFQLCWWTSLFLRLVARSGPRASPLASRQELGCALACFLPGSLAWLSMEREGARKRGRGGEEGGGASTGKGHSPPTCYFTLRVGRAAHIITTSPKDVESLFSLFLRQACGEEKTPETELAFSGAVAGEGGPAKVVKPGLDQAAAGGGGGDRPHVLLEPQPGRLEVRADAGPSTQETPVDSERMSPRAPPPAAPEGSGRHAERGDVEGRRTAVKRSDDPLADISLHVMRRSSIGDVLAWVRASLLEDSGARAESSEASGMGGAAPQLFGGKTQGSERACTGGEESTTPSCASRSQEETQLKDVKGEGEEAKHLHSPPSDSPAWKKPRVSPGVDAPEGMEEAARRVKEELASSPLSSSWSQREERVLYIYTDGACRSNGRGREARGGIGVFFGDGDPRNVSMRLLGQPQTNQRAELQAILCAIRLLKAWEDGGRGYWGPVGAAGAKGEASGDAASEGARSGGGPRQAKDAGGGVSSCGLVAASDRVAPLSQRAGLAPSGRAAFATVAGNGKRVNGVELPQGDGGGTVTRRAKVDTSLDRGGAPCGGLHADRETFFEMHDPVKVRICSDSSYAINCITEWVYAWKMNGWRTRARSEVCNRDLVAEIDQLLQGRRRGDARFSSLPATTGADPVFVSGGSDGSDGHGGGEIARFFEKPKEVGDGRSSAAAEGWGGRGSIEFVLVKGHSGNYGNDRADQLACQGAALPSDDEEAAQ